MTSDALDPDLPGEGSALPPVQPTGHPDIDDALARLERLPEVPVTEHGAIYDDIHQVLRTTLAEAGRPGADQASTPSAP